MDYSTIKQVKSVDDDKSANDLLAQGWVLLHVGVHFIADTVQIGGDTFQLSNPLYILGKAE